MALPNFLTSSSSPPRSPHVAPPGYFDLAYPSSPSSSRPSRIMGALFRPTRRDLLLCLLTLSFSYLLFSPSPTSNPTPHPIAAIKSTGSGIGSSTSRYKLPWTSIFKGDSCPQSGHHITETTFTDSVKSAGIPDSGDAVVGEKWDAGVEEADEDDEVLQGETILRGHQPGWTLFEKLYLYNGSFYIVTHEKDDWPELRMMTSTGLPAIPGNGEEREPKGHEIIFITPTQAAKLWGSRVFRMEGSTWLFNDGQFIDHYYHFAAELLLGTWRAYASLDPDINAQGQTSLPPPRRVWFLHQQVNEWRDTPKFNPTILFNLFPSASMLYPQDFDDLNITTSSHVPSAFVMDRALLADRSAAFRGPWTGPTARTVAGAIRIGTVSRWWWEPIRRQILRYAGVPEEIIDRNLEGFGAVDPALKEAQPGPGVKEVEPLAPQGNYAPVVTYISRQSSRRRLTPEAHADLVEAVTLRSKKLGFEFVVVEAERMTKEEQFALAARTTIMLGVHGNGLTHLLWMPPTPRSTVIEMFYRGGFARDYQWTAHALGIKHFGIQHDEKFTAPNIPEVAYPEGFQGTAITVVGKVVADLIEDRLAGKI